MEYGTNKRKVMKLFDIFKRKEDTPKGHYLEAVNINKKELSPEEKTIAKLNGIRVLQALSRKSGNVIRTGKEATDKFIKYSVSSVKDSAGGSAKLGSYAMDSCDEMGNVKNNFAISDKVGRFLASTDAFLGWQVCALLAQNWLINRVCAAHGEDAMSSGYRLLSYSDDDLDVDELEEIKQDSESRYDISQKCMDFSFKKRMFGGAICIPVVKGANYEKEFNLDDIKPDSYLGMRVIEPYWLTYEFEDGDNTNALNVNFYEPTYYRVAGETQRIHRSWVIKRNNAPVSDILKPTFYFYGIPSPQMIYDRVYCFNRIANEAPLLAMTKRLVVLDADIENMVANPEYAKEMLEAVTQLRDNFGVMVKSPDNAVSQLDTTLTDFDMLIQKQGEIAAAIGEIPLDKIVKTSNKNANSGGIFQENEYKGVLRRVRMSDCYPILMRHYQLYLRSEKKSKQRIGIKFNPLDTPNEIDAAKTREIEAMTIAHLASLGIIDAAEGRKFLRSNPDSNFTWLSKDMPEPELDLDDLKDELGGNGEAEKAIEAKSEFEKMGGEINKPDNASRYAGTGIGSSPKGVSNNAK